MDNQNETDDVEAVRKLGEARDKIVAELRKAIVGMDDVIDELMIAIFARGHCLLVGVPGLAKTLLVKLVDCRGRVIAKLLPDVVGEIGEEKRGSISYRVSYTQSRGRPL